MQISIQLRLILTFFMLWLAHFISIDNQEVIGYVGIFVFGLLHGANDLALIETIKDQKLQKHRTGYLIQYLVGVFMGMLIFYFIPIVGLVVFVMVSGYHFGNQHWKLERQVNKSLLPFLFEGLYGLLILGILFATHQHEVRGIVQTITRVSLLEFNITGVTFALGFAVLLLGSILAMENGDFRKKIPLNIFYIGVFAVLFYYSGLIWGFSMYFVLWHSIPSIEDQIQFLYPEKSRENWKKYLSASFLYWGMATFGVLVAYFGIGNAILFKAVFFSLIAAITFPHTLIIAWMQHSMQKKVGPKTRLPIH